jgi:beta-lactamase regulating signal transducer with metallopeptidase domain
MEALNTQLSPFLEWLVKTTIEGSVLIALIVLVKFTLRDRLPIRWHYWLWVLLLIRLVTPWAPKTKLSAFNFIPHSFELQRIQLVSQAEKRIRPPVKSAIDQREKPGPVTSTIADTNVPKLVTGIEPAPQIEAVQKPAPVETVAVKQRKWSQTIFIRLCSILPFVWLIGAAGLAGFILVRNFSLWRLVKRERPITDSQILELLEDCKMQMGIQTIVGVVVTDKVKGPALFGFVRPRLLLPEGLIEDLGLDELYYVFIHELCHLKRRDVYLGWLISLLQILHWFNPLMWFAFHRMRLDREFACDALAVSTMNAEETPVYGRTILNLLERFSQVSYVPSIAGILEDSSQIERRIKMIAKSKKTSPVQRAAAVLIFAVLAGVGLTDAYPAPPPFNFGTPVNLGPNVNTSSADRGAIISADGCTMYMHSDRPGGYGDYDVFVATRENRDDEWGPPVNLGQPVNAANFDGPWSISADGLSLYLVSNRGGGYGSVDLWVTTRATTSVPWGAPVNLGPTVNTSYADADPKISPDGLSLYFASWRPGGYGSADLWVTTRATRSSLWGPPVNLGPSVNSSSWDYQPSISADGLSLFFTSGRPGGLGPDDIWVTTRATVSDPWGPPVNLGPPVNTSADDFCPDISADGSTLYFTSTRPGGYGGYDIWQAPILSAPTCGDAAHPYPAVDLNKDCRVDLADLALLVAHWLECTAPECD